MKIAFSIILNGLHHLTHNNYYKTMLENFDLWVVAEGASKNNGSTSWCREMKNEYHNNGRSVDGTLDFLTPLTKQSNFKLVTTDGFWHSKDQQVNAAITIIKNYTKQGTLFQVDIDEQWSKDQLDLAETELLERKLKTGGCLADCYIGKDLLAKGEWGESSPSGYIRVWDWKGEQFSSHEPPRLEDESGLFGTLKARFTHYNYYFEQDVKFKNDWYTGHDGILDRWKHINSLPKDAFPIHISNLITGGWGRSNTVIIKEDKK